MCFTILWGNLNGWTSWSLHTCRVLWMGCLPPQHRPSIFCRPYLIQRHCSYRCPSDHLLWRACHYLLLLPYYNSIVKTFPNLLNEREHWKVSVLSDNAIITKSIVILECSDHSVLAELCNVAVLMLVRYVSLTNSHGLHIQLRNAIDLTDVISWDIQYWIVLIYSETWNVICWHWSIKRHIMIFLGLCYQLNHFERDSAKPDNVSLEHLHAFLKLLVKMKLPLACT